MLPIPGKLHAYELTIKSTQRLQTGPIDFVVTLKPEVAGEEAVPPYQLPIRGLILPDIQATPPSVTFGAKAVGEALEDAFTLSSLTGREFKIVRWDLDGQGLTVDRSNQLANTLHVRQQVISTGSH